MCVCYYILIHPFIYLTCLCLIDETIKIVNFQHQDHSPACEKPICASKSKHVHSTCVPGDSVNSKKSQYLEKGTSRQRSGKGAIRKRFPLQKPRWEKTKLTIRYLYHETYRKPNEQLFSQ